MEFFCYKELTFQSGGMSDKNPTLKPASFQAYLDKFSIILKQKMNETLHRLG